MSPPAAPIASTRGGASSSLGKIMHPSKCWAADVRAHESLLHGGGVGGRLETSTPRAVSSRRRLSSGQVSCAITLARFTPRLLENLSPPPAWRPRVVHPDSPEEG